MKNLWHDLGESEKQFLDGIISIEEKEDQLERAWDEFVRRETDKSCIQD